MSNLKQIGLGLMQYTQDFDERLPYTSISEGGVIRSWMDMTYPYVKNVNIYFCPSDSTSAADPNRFRLSGSQTVGRRASYAINAAYTDGLSRNLIAPSTEVDRRPATHLSQIGAPATSLWITDSFRRSVTGNFAFYTFVNRPPVLYTNEAWRYWQIDPGVHLTEPHLGLMSSLFTDGHVKAMNLNEITKTNTAGYLHYLTVGDDAN